MPPPKGQYNLIIADKPYPIDWPTYTFQDDDPGFNGTLQTCTVHSHGRCGAGGTPFAPAKGMGKNPARMRKRHVNERSLAAAQAVVKQFVVHLDGCTSAEMCFNVLHNERGLSCHFIVDNDGTIYQTVDLIDCAYHAAGLNETSIGVEISNRGDAKKDPGRYDNAPPGQQRDIVRCQINDSLYVAYDFTKGQYDAMQALGQALARYLPGIKLDYPQTGLPGELNTSVLYATEEEASVKLKASYSGYLGHYHITRRKWDPGPFDFKKMLGKMAGRRSFPIGLHGQAKAEVPEAPLPGKTDEREDYLRTFQAYYDNNEIEGGGGFFPVGPLDHYQLYHGGIHLHAEKGTNVTAPTAGKVILARNGPTVLGIGNTNFVLLEHHQAVGTEQLTYYTLFMHLAEEKTDKKKSERLKWMLSDGWENAEAGKVTPIDPAEPVQAGEVIGHVGIAGPEGESQLHWEIFTLNHATVAKIDKAGFWKVYSGASDQRYCTNKEILANIETKKDGVITQEELLDHFRGDPAAREWTHQAVTFHYSEWSEKPDWKVALTDAPEYRRKPKRAREIEEMYEEQILPTIWWRDDIAQRIKLPAEARVYTYHPVSFLRWLNDLVGTKQVEVSRKATKADYDAANGEGQLDIDDTDGSSFVNESDLALVAPSQQLQLPDLIDGYGD